MKKLFSLLLVLALLCALLPQALAAGSGLEVLGEGGSCGDNLTWGYSQGVLTISGTGDMEDFSVSGYPWTEVLGLDEIEVVEIEEGVTSIGPYAFELCTRLEQVFLPESLTEIGIWAFAGCQWLEQINLPAGLDKIDEGVFYGCADLDSITIPAGVGSIGIAAFHDCEDLQLVRLPQGLTRIDNSAFYGCDSLACITIPYSVNSIGNNALAECPSLSHVLYTGTEAQWAQVTITENIDGGDPLNNATVHCNARGDEVYLLGEKLYCSICGKYLDGSVPSSPFTDVKPSDYFYAPVLWAVQNNITTGVGGGRFAPSDPCTRGQIVTFLWRACGTPEPVSSNNPFSDVQPNAYYYKAVLWAVEQGITTGLSASRFGPDAICTRGQVATFLWRACGEPQPQSSASPFSDVQPNAYYYDAVLWAVESDVTQGTGGGKFSPDANCTRGQIVTFLFRALAEA